MLEDGLSRERPRVHVEGPLHVPRRLLERLREIGHLCLERCAQLLVVPLAHGESGADQVVAQPVRNDRCGASVRIGHRELEDAGAAQCPNGDVVVRDGLDVSLNAGRGQGDPNLARAGHDRTGRVGDRLGLGKAGRIRRVQDEAGLCRIHRGRVRGEERSRTQAEARRQEDEQEVTADHAPDSLIQFHLVSVLVVRWMDESGRCLVHGRT